METKSFLHLIGAFLPSQPTGGVNKNVLVFEKSCSLNIEVMILENSLLLFPIRPIRVSKLPGFNLPFLPVHKKIFCRKQKAPFAEESIENNQ